LSVLSDPARSTKLSTDTYRVATSGAVEPEPTAACDSTVIRKMAWLRDDKWCRPCDCAMPGPAWTLATARFLAPCSSKWMTSWTLLISSSTAGMVRTPLTSRSWSCGSAAGGPADLAVCVTLGDVDLAFVLVVGVADEATANEWSSFRGESFLPLAEGAGGTNDTVSSSLTSLSSSSSSSSSSSLSSVRAAALTSSDGIGFERPPCFRPSSPSGDPANKSRSCSLYTSKNCAVTL
jgi:hypothetical protein